MQLGDFYGKIGLWPIFPNIVGRCYLYATLPCPPYRTGPTYATGPRSARVNAPGTPRFAHTRSATPKTGQKGVKNGSKLGPNTDAAFVVWDSNWRAGATGPRGATPSLNGFPSG